ncbi:protein FAM83E isoform X2 [Hemibagrus wyckioides]|uniref:protein FAM83E isoform X2 n=1 Tax=Hemibagrus wyckioides TaxID=337641 RepID=UPI00266CADD6|nr:protein FAM83E isoform X2 [Hemibagrus wyckioides]
MSRYQETSLNDDVVFLPANESNPGFLHSEVERNALESLIRYGPKAFYSELNAHRLEPFLSSEEVNQVSNWVEERNVEVVENGGIASENSSGEQELSDQYFPEISDTPAPCLELGWPEKDRWEGVERVMIYSNPPVEQAPHIREVIRKLLQGATMLIAIVADRLTDSTVIGDLHSAASRDVVVYIILNQRPAQDNLTHNQLKHPKISVRILGGNTFATSDGKKVVGELKENFVLVDLETVVLGSSGLTWIDAHLHRQLITVLSGPAVALYDREFRILYAASTPVPDSWKSAKPIELPVIDGTLNQPEQNAQNQVLEDCPPSPPPPPENSPIDWETLGVFQKTEDSAEDLDLPEFTQEPPTLPDWQTGPPGAGVTELHITEWQEESKLYRFMAEPRHAQDHQTMFWNTQKPERLPYSFLKERNEGQTMFRPRDFRMERMLMEDFGAFSRSHQHDSLPSLDRIMGENTIPEETTLGSAAAPVYYKNEKSWNLGDVLKKMNDHSTKGLQSNLTKNTISKSNLDLSSPGTETLQRSQSQANLYDNFPMTPALALMKKRNDEIKSSFLRNLHPLPRPRSFSLGLKKSSFLREKHNDEDK